MIRQFLKLKGLRGNYNTKKVLIESLNKNSF